MTCGQKTSLYQLEFVVKSISRCSCPEEELCGTAVSIRFLEYPEQTVCELPGKPDGMVNLGKTYTFAMPSDGCGPSTVPINVRLYRTTGGVASPCREELASGRVDVVPTVSCGGEVDDDELTVTMKCCLDGRAVAVLTVLARVWCPGSVLTTPLRDQPVTSACCLGGQTSQPRSQVQLTQQNCSKAEDGGCSRKKQQPQTNGRCDAQPAKKCRAPQPAKKCCGPSPPVKKCCGPSPPVKKCCGPSQPKTCRRQCGQCLPTVKPPLCSKAGIPALANNTRQIQYTTVGCELDGHKLDMLVRKKNYETCAVQRTAATKADEFASRVMAMVREMHGLVADSVGAKTDQLNAL